MPIDLTDLAPGTGFVIQGDADFDQAGSSVASAGDVNGDGIDDLIVGAQGGDDGGTFAGEAYVVYGVTGAPRARVDLAALTAGNGFVIQGDAAGDRAGWSVSSAGDVNGDGLDDMIVGAPLGDDGGSEAGEAYVVYGAAGATRARVDLTTLGATGGFVIQGDAAGDLAGRSVAAAGDVNADGVDDLIVGAPFGDAGDADTGEAHIIYGMAGVTRERLDLTALAASDGFAIQGDAEGDQAGFSVAAAGDVNGDGIDDLIVGAPFGDDGGTVAGEAYVVYGRSGATRGRLDLTALTAAEGFVIQGDAADDNAAWSAAAAGDVDGDGIGDLIVGAHRGDDGGAEAGEAYVVYGEAGATRTRIDLSAMGAAAGFVIQGDAADDLAGWSVAAAGDVNGDRVQDLIIGAPNGDDGGANAGEAYVVYGVADRTRARIDLTALTDTDGFVIRGDGAGDGAGVSVAGAGDVNGDGANDLIIGAPFGDDGGTNAGEAYVIYGGSTIGAPQPSLDIDGDGQAAALTDGLLIVRYLFSFTGTSLVEGAVGAEATRTDAAALLASLNGLGTALDADADDAVMALTDGLLILRYLFAFTGTALTDGAVGAAATRDAAEIAAYLESLMPESRPSSAGAVEEGGGGSASAEIGDGTDHGADAGLAFGGVPPASAPGVDKSISAGGPVGQTFAFDLDAASRSAAVDDFVYRLKDGPNDVDAAALEHWLSVSSVSPRTATARESGVTMLADTACPFGPVEGDADAAIVIAFSPMAVAPIDDFNP